MIVILSLLLNTGADPNAKNSGGVRPLHFAAMAAWRLEDASLVEILCKYEANVNSQASSLYDARPLDIALETPTFIRASGLEPGIPILNCTRLQSYI